MADAYVTLATTAPDAPDSADVCRLYGTIVDLSGRPVPNAQVEAMIEAFEELPGGMSSSALISDTASVKTFTRADGSFALDLLRGAVVAVALPTSSALHRLLVPDTDVTPLVQQLFPMPETIRWVYSATLDGVYSEASSPLEVDVDDEVFLSLEVEWSNGHTERFHGLWLLASGSPEFNSGLEEGSSLPAYKVQVLEAGDVTISVDGETMLGGASDILEGFGAPFPDYPDPLPYEAYVPTWPSPLVLRAG